MDARVLVSMEGEGKRGRRSYYVKDASSDFHTSDGFIKSSELSIKEGVVKTNKGKSFALFQPNFIDAIGKIKRGPQIIPIKDIGLIVAFTGIGRHSRVVEAGAGSGYLTAFLANIAGRVYSYDVRDDFIAIARKNIEFLGLRNVSVKKGDVYKGIRERNINVFILDLPEPWNAVGSALKVLKRGGFLVAYTPSIPQTMDFVEAVSMSGERGGGKLIHIATKEIISREWEVKGRKVRPRTLQLGHSGFISFARRIC